MLRSPLASFLQSFQFKSLKMTMSVDLRAMRQPYREDQDVLLESKLPTLDPVKLFGVWFEEALEAKKNGKLLEPNAVCLSTATLSGIPSSRMVLLKGFGNDGFKIFTNLASRKGKELLENPNAALMFYWDPFNKQVRIEGRVELLPDEESREYFESRPKRSQIAAAISDQSLPIESRDVLIQKYNELEQKFADKTFVPKPKTWGGFRVIPHRFEFWQGQSSRLHDRILFTRKVQEGDAQTKEQDSSSSWNMERLQP